MEIHGDRSVFIATGAYNHQPLKRPQLTVQRNCLHARIVFKKVQVDDMDAPLQSPVLVSYRKHASSANSSKSRRK